MRRYRHVNSEHDPSDRQAKFEWRYFGNLGKTVNDWRKNNKADIKEDGNTEEERCQSQRSDSSFVT
ncbi:hypothetical protein KLPMMMO221M1_26460 [Klebsiella pneumoniae]